jgi:hypothetical protein
MNYWEAGVAPSSTSWRFPAKEGLEVKYVGIIRLIELKCPDEKGT